MSTPAERIRDRVHLNGTAAALPDQFDDILERIAPVVPGFHNEWQADCPNCQGGSVSGDQPGRLWIGLGRDGRLRAHCNHGCDISAINTALGSDLVGQTPHEFDREKRHQQGDTPRSEPPPAEPKQRADDFADVPPAYTHAFKKLYQLGRYQGKNGPYWKAACPCGCGHPNTQFAFSKGGKLLWNCPKGCDSSHAAKALMADVFPLLGDWQDGDPTVRAEAAPRFEFVTDAEFIAGDYRPEFLVKNVLVKGQPCGIGGPMKAMKTGISVDLHCSLGTGTAFLGEFAVPRAVTTVMVSGESGKATLLETRDRVLKAKGLPHGTARDTLHWCFDVPNLSDVAAMAEFTEMLVARKPEVVILDPLYLMLGDVNAASMFETGNLLRTVATKLTAAGATTVICHHANRQLAVGSPMNLQNLSHAGFAEFVRQYILINRRTEYAKGTGHHELIVGIGGSSGHGGEFHVDIDEGVIDEYFRGRFWDVRVTKADDAEAGQQYPDPAAAAEEKAAKKTAALLAKGAAKKAKFLADIEAETAKGFEALTQNKMKTDYGWQFPDIKAVAECLLLDKKIELHTFRFQAGKGAKQTATGFRRFAPKVQPAIPFGHQPVEKLSAGFSEPSEPQPADAGDGGGRQSDQPVEMSPYIGGLSPGEPADAGHPDSEPGADAAKSGRQKQPADAAAKKSRAKAKAKSTSKKPKRGTK